MIHLLPTELKLLILAHLTLHEIAMVQCVCLRWRDFVNDNAEAIFVAASKFHGYGKGGQEHCKRRKQIERACIGYGHARLSFHAYASNPSTPELIYRFKIDEKNKFIITSFQFPFAGIKVWDMETPTLLWHLTNVRAHAHIEYSNGFLVFDNGLSIEIWRHEPEFHLPPHPPTVLPHSSPSSGRGVFRPFSKFTYDEIWAFRLVYPTLFVASPWNLYLWDIPTTRLACTVRGFQTEDEIGDVTYVDLNDNYLVVCGSSGLGLFKRPAADQERVAASDYRVLLLDTGDYPVDDVANYQVSQDNPSIEDEQIIKPLKLEEGVPNYPSLHLSAEIEAAHIEGNTLVALLSRSHLLYIPDLSDPDSPSKTLQLGPAASEGQYLAFNNSRVAVATTRGIFIINLPRYSPIDPTTLLSPLRVSLVHSLTNRVKIPLLSCLQLSEDALWATWRGHADGKVWIFDDQYGSVTENMYSYFMSSSQVCRVGFDVEEQTRQVQ